MKTFNQLFLNKITSLLENDAFNKICVVPCIRVYSSLGKFTIEFDLSVNWYDLSDFPDFGQRKMFFCASHDMLRVQLEFSFSDKDYE